MLIKEHSLWVEKYRPQTLDDFIGNEQVKEKVGIFLQSGDLGNLLLSGPAGTGKTSLAKLIINQLGCDYLYINASDENSVDTIRDKVKGFASTVSLGGIKIIILDECLTGDTLVTVLREGVEQKIPIAEVDENLDLAKSYNIDTNQVEWQPFYLWDNGDHEIWEVELENGELIRCTAEHKWFVKNINGDIIIVPTKELDKFNHILSPM